MNSQNSQRSAPLNSNSESRRLAQGAEFVTNGNGHQTGEQIKQKREEDESPLSIFARSVTDAKAALLQSLRKKLSSVKEESRIDVITANRKVHEVEIENSKLSQEISKEKEENKRSALSFQLSQDFIVDLERKLDEMTKRNKENESKLEENIRENSRLQSILNEKEAEIDKLTVALNRSLAAQYQNIVNQVQNSSTAEEKITPSSDALPISPESTPEPLPEPLPKAVSESPEKLNHQLLQVSFEPPQKIQKISLAQLQENLNIRSDSPQKISTTLPQKTPEVLATPSPKLLPTLPQEIRKLVSALPIKIPISVLRQIPKTPIAPPEKESPKISSALTQEIIKTSPALISIKPMAELLETSTEDENDASCSGSRSNGQYSEQNPISNPQSPTDHEISEEQDEAENYRSFLGQNGARALKPELNRATKIKISMETENQVESSSMSNLAAIQVSMETVRHEKPKSKPAPAEISKKKVQTKSISTPVIKSIEISKNLDQQNPALAPTTSLKSTKISKKAPVVAKTQTPKENAKGQKNVIPQKKSGISISLQVKRKRPVLKSSALAVFDDANGGKSSEPENTNDEDEEEKPSKKKRKKMTESLAVASCSKKPINPIQLEPIFILNVPKVHRINYTFINNSELDNCPRASKFWYDPNPQCYSNGTKLLIRFYDDTKPWQESHLHVKEQTKLAEPKIKHMKFHEITKHLESLSKTKNAQCLWFDVRDFNIFSSKMSPFFKNFGPSVTHFSFGRRLYSFDEVSASRLLNFILDHFPNLEYLAVNDGMLKKMAVGKPLKLKSEKRLEKLKTIRLITVAYRISTPLIIELLLRAPCLEKIYGIPLHCLSEIELSFETMGISKVPSWCKKHGGISTSKKTNGKENEDSESNSNSSSSLDSDVDVEICMDFIKDVLIIRNMYDEASIPADLNPRNFYTDISTLSRLGPPLEVVDVRTYFIRDPEMRGLCVEKWSKILNSIKTSVKSLKIEPNQMKNFPRLENLHTLHFHLNIRHLDDDFFSGYFPPGFDLNFSFPQLTTVEIVLNEKSSLFLKGGEESRFHDLFCSHFPLDVFRPRETFNGVERLNLVNFAPHCSIPDLKGLFPRITVLQLSLELKALSNILPMIYKFWPSLKQLILAVTFSDHDNYNLDSAFTGMHFLKCRILHEEIRNQEKDSSLELAQTVIEKRVEIYRLKPSIQNLKDLTLLKIVLMRMKTDGDEDYEIADCLMTPVSGIYGFGPALMPTLKVMVGFGERMTRTDKKSVMKLLKPMESYLTLDN